MLSIRRFARRDPRRAFLAGFALMAFFAQAVAAVDSTISITTQQRIQVGDAVKFQQGGKPPYTLKVLLNNSVVAQNEGWTGTSVQWRATPEQLPAGTEIKIRITDSRGEMVLSDATKVMAAGASGSDNADGGKDRQSQQQHQAQHTDGEGERDGAVRSGNAQHMDDPTGSGAHGDEGEDDLEALPAVPPRGPGNDIGGERSSEGLDSGSSSMMTGIDHAGAVAMPTAAEAMSSPSAPAGSSVSQDSASGALPTSNAALSGSSSTATTSTPATSASDASAAAASSSAVSDSTDSSESGASNKTLYIGIGVVVVLLAGAGLAFFFWRRNKQQSDEEEEAQEKKATRKRKGKGKASSRGGTAGGAATDSQGDDEEKLVGGSDAGHDAYGSEGSDEEAPRTSSKKGSARRSGRSSQVYHDDDGASEGLESDDRAPPRRSK
ncbi:hypothetical protein BMF94_6439 [Rhodotorula taiwanensis]|uniref:Uncharacterized protein n=1 Tax=Rhodotorula taiwanensis TaxID=741276 RepID=A0A2S5B1A4_9BASI|nr:hypothetical protein BMF94_6439 [Rhodotorula taiwanensis]